MMAYRSASSLLGAVTVPLPEQLRYQWILRVLAEEGFNVLVTGAPGCGKTAMAQQELSAVMKSDSFTLTSTIGFTAGMTSGVLQDLLQSRLEKRRRRPINL